LALLSNCPANFTYISHKYVQTLCFQ
jgi:hypothetical protein